MSARPGSYHDRSTRDEWQEALPRTHESGGHVRPSPAPMQTGTPGTGSMCGMRTTGRLRSIIRPFLLAGGLLLLLASGAGALATPKLSSQITDQTGVLGSDQTSVQSALDSLQNGQNVQLWVVFIPTTGSATAPDFARQTFEANLSLIHI